MLILNKEERYALQTLKNIASNCARIFQLRALSETKDIVWDYPKIVERFFKV